MDDFLYNFYLWVLFKFRGTAYSRGLLFMFFDSLVLVLYLSYCTNTFMVEAMSTVNAAMWAEKRQKARGQEVRISRFVVLMVF